MKRLHRKDLYCWSVFREAINVDFNGTLWVRDEGNVLIDPLPMSAHDRAHLAQLGGVKTVVLTNSDHVRGAQELGPVEVLGPLAEQATFPIRCARWLSDGDQIVPGLLARTLDGSKTKGELALVLEDTTLITGDLIRAHRAGSLMLLRPEQGLKSEVEAVASIRRLLELHPKIEAVLVGDGWSVFREGALLLGALIS